MEGVKRFDLLRFFLELVGVLEAVAGVRDDAGGHVEGHRLVVPPAGAADEQHVAAVEELHGQAPVLSVGAALPEVEDEWDPFEEE